MSNNFNEKLDQALELLKGQDIAGAEKVFDEIIKSKPNKIDPYYFYAILKGQFKKDYNSAIYYLKKALNIAPFFEAYKALAENYLLLADLKNALFYLKQALVFDSTSKECLLYLNRYFPKEANFINNNPIKIEGIIENTKLLKDVEYKKVYDAGVIERKPPKFIEELLTENQKKVLFNSIDNLKKMFYEEGFAVKLPNGKGFFKQSEQTHILTEDNQLLNDIFNHQQQPFNGRENSINIADNLLVLSTCYSGNFYHWLTWTIPKLYIAEKAGYSLKSFDKIAVNYLGYSFQNQILSHLNIPINKIVGTIPNGVVLQAKNLVATSVPHSKITPPIVIESLRNKFLTSDSYDTNSPKKIYLSRKKSSARHILNEDILTNFLEKEGYTIICAEDYTFFEQVKLFANAENVISQHGAGLVNLAFCSPNAKVIEIHDEEELWKQRKLPDGTITKNQISDNAFMRISADNNLQHHIMYGDVFGIDMNVNMDKFKATYELMLSAR